MKNKEPLQEESIIKKQQQFVDWLKNKGLYNPMETGQIMQKMQDVWDACRSGWNKHICDDFPYPAECWDCKKGSCEGCSILE